MKKCPECKKLIEDNLKECPECGFPFDNTNKPTEESDSGKDIDVNLENEKLSDVTDNPVDETVSELEENSNKEFQTILEVENLDTDNIELQEEKKSESKSNNDIEQMIDVNKKKIGLNKQMICKIVVGVVLVISLISVFYFNGKAHEYEKKYKDVTQELETVSQKNDSLEATVSKLNSKIEELENGAAAQLVDIKNAYEKGEWEKVVDLASKLHEKYNGSEEDKQAQEMSAQSQAKIDEVKAAKEAEKAKGYETGITYNQLARTPDKYKDKKVKFSGKVVQVIEGDDSVQIRLAVNDDYDTILLGEYSTSIVSSRVLEDDHITIYGTSVGTISYESTMGGTITIPGVYIDKIKQ